jgi:branched-chain amino acid transport system ATP-binding protein
VSAGSTRSADALLRVDGLEVAYAGVQALAGVSLAVRAGEVVTVIGANGAGKTSLVHAVTGVVPKRGGTVTFDGLDVTRMAPEDLVARGLTLVPERRELFGALSVQDNLRLGAFLRASHAAAVRRDLARVYDVFPRLAERRRQRAGTLSGGEQQMLALGRAMMSGPRLLLLDEPSLGLAPLIVQEILRVIAALRDEGVTVLLIEQNARAALRLADYGYLLEAGEVVTEAPADRLERDERVRAAYLGAGPMTN